MRASASTASDAQQRGFSRLAAGSLVGRSLVSGAPRAGRGDDATPAPRLISHAAPHQRQAATPPPVPNARDSSGDDGKPAQVRRPPGLDARQLAVACLVGRARSRTHSRRCLRERAGAFASSPLEPRDRAFARLLVTTVLRRKGELDAVLGSFLDKPLPEKRGALSHILLVGGSAASRARNAGPRRHQPGRRADPHRQIRPALRPPDERRPASRRDRWRRPSRRP